MNRLIDENVNSVNPAGYHSTKSLEQIKNEFLLLESASDIERWNWIIDHRSFVEICITKDTLVYLNDSMFGENDARLTLDKSIGYASGIHTLLDALKIKSYEP